MTATIELQSARRKLQVALGDSGADYFRQLKLWFRKHISKDIFDTEARRLLSPDDSHLHNEFLLAILNKCQTLANLPTNNVVGVAAAAASPVKLSASTTTTGAVPHASSMNQVVMAPGASPTAAAELVVPRNKCDPGGLAVPGNERLKVGKARRKNSKSNKAAFEQRFAPVNLASAAPDTDTVVVAAAAANGAAAPDSDADRTARFAHREAPLLPDAALVHGRLLLAAWEEGVEKVEEEAVSLVLLAVEQQLRKLVTALLVQRNGYKVREGNYPHSVGSRAPNPWLKNVQRRLLRQEASFAGPREVAEVLPDPPEKLLMADIDPLVPVGRQTVTDLDQVAALEDACATRAAEMGEARRKRKGSAVAEKAPVSLFDLMGLLKRHKSLIPSHTVYALNMERIVARLYHRGRDE